jgi:hypothetical protein
MAKKKKLAPIQPVVEVDPKVEPKAPETHVVPANQ